MRSRLIALTMASACGPTADATNGDGGGSSSGGGTEQEDESSGPPLRVCDPSFDSGLAPAQPIWTFAFATDLSTTRGTMAVDEQGTIYAAGGYSVSGPDEDAWVFAVDRDGGLQWEYRYAGATGRSDMLSGVATTVSGDLIVVGFEQTAGDGPVDDRQFVVIALGFARDGEQLWRSEIVDLPRGFEPDDPPPHVATGRDGRIFVSVTSRADDGSELPFLVEVTATGEPLAVRQFPADISSGLSIVDAGFDDNGRLYALASGGSFSDETDFAWLGRWDAEGAFLGAFVAPGEGPFLAAVRLRSADAIMLSARRSEPTIPYRTRPILRRLGSDGDELWSRRIDMEGDDTLLPNALVNDCDGRSLVLASVQVSPWLFVLDEAGVELERHALAFGEYTGVIGMAADPFGNPVVLSWDSSSESREIRISKLAR